MSSHKKRTAPASAFTRAVLTFALIDAMEEDLAETEARQLAGQILNRIGTGSNFRTGS